MIKQITKCSKKALFVCAMISLSSLPTYAGSDAWTTWLKIQREKFQQQKTTVCDLSKAETDRDGARKQLNQERELARARRSTLLQLRDEIDALLSEDFASGEAADNKFLNEGLRLKSMEHGRAKDALQKKQAKELAQSSTREHSNVVGLWQMLGGGTARDADLVVAQKRNVEKRHNQEIDQLKQAQQQDLVKYEAMLYRQRTGLYHNLRIVQNESLLKSMKCADSGYCLFADLTSLVELK